MSLIVIPGHNPSPGKPINPVRFPPVRVVITYRRRAGKPTDDDFECVGMRLAGYICRVAGN